MINAVLLPLKVRERTISNSAPWHTLVITDLESRAREMEGSQHETGSNPNQDLVPKHRGIHQSRRQSTQSHPEDTRQCRIKNEDPFASDSSIMEREGAWDRGLAEGKPGRGTTF